MNLNTVFALSILSLATTAGCTLDQTELEDEELQAAQSELVMYDDEVVVPNEGEPQVKKNELLPLGDPSLEGQSFHKPSPTCNWYPPGASTSSCHVDIDTSTVSCSGFAASRVSTVSTHNGMVLEVDMAGLEMLQVGALAQNISGYTLNIGNSPSNNAWRGDASHFANDSEMHVYNNTLFVWGNDNIGSPQLLKKSNVLPDKDGVLWAGVCDSEFLWYSWDQVNPSTSAYLTDPVGLFQIDGNEPDAQAGGVNDTKLYVGLERTIGTASRTGVDLYDSPISGNPGDDVTLILLDF